MENTILYVAYWADLEKNCINRSVKIRGVFTDKYKAKKALHDHYYTYRNRNDDRDYYATYRKIELNKSGYDSDDSDSDEE